MVRNWTLFQFGVYFVVIWLVLFCLTIIFANILNGGLLMLLAVNRLLVACNAVARANRVICLFVLNSNTSSIVVVSMVGL